MSVARSVILAVVTCAWTSPAVAQSIPPLPSRPFAIAVPSPLAEAPAQQLATLARWTRDYGEWRTWYGKWQNRPEPGWLSLRERRQAPDPPPWLAATCAARFEESGPVAEACAAWREWRDRGEAASVAVAQQARSRQQQEAPDKTKWWERLHVDALWPMTQAGSSTLGVAGMHATVQLTKRFQVFLVPGVMLMRVPALTGGMTWTAGTDWGFSLRLFDFHVPGATRPSTLHFNMVRVWTLGQQGIQTPGEMYLAGFSMSFKRR
jgi:hypothetical protein